MLPAKTSATSGEKQSAGMVMAKVSEMPVLGGSDKSTIAGSANTNSMTSKENLTLSFKQVEDRSKSEIATADKRPKS